MIRPHYIPALRFHRLTRFYDAVLARTMNEASLKRSLIDQAVLGPGMRVLDLGCGTATLGLLVKGAHPTVELHGLDADEHALALARNKALEARLDIQFHQGYAQHAPFETGCFDRVLSCLVFHHLHKKEKLVTLMEAHRLLKPGGQLHIADWGRPLGALQRLAFLSVQVWDGFETTGDSVTGILPSLMTQAGFQDVEETRRDGTIYGTLAFYRATRLA